MRAAWAIAKRTNIRRERHPVICDRYRHQSGIRRHQAVGSGAENGIGECPSSPGAVDHPHTIVHPLRSFGLKGVRREDTLRQGRRQHH